MAKPARKTVEHTRGDDFRITFRVDKYVVENDPNSGTEPRDLTGWTVEVESDPDVADDVTPNPLDSTGTVTIFIPRTDLGIDQKRTVEFDVFLTDPDGFGRTYLHVTIVLTKRVE